ncbi:hypothetical protein [Streptosporangium subroseum]|uniref:hypothetical protein n=1 Tax=Streptosporangium subroseum TaxID=106412 RepID=UPI003088A25D|nr:hypothetical protein OHB15_26785 [Streptosporangium subroseum]
MRPMFRTGTLTSVAAVLCAGAVIAVAPPANAASWSLYRVYASNSTCVSTGEAAVDTGYAQKWKCEWDSPFFGLWLYR